jgi:peptidoglycan/LPS O-acetylase OafA/YrhL
MLVTNNVRQFVNTIPAFFQHHRGNELHRGEIRALTGLRGVAACYVVLYHFHGLTAPDGLVGNLLRHGYIAVDLFFILSGFVMALTYADSFRLGTTARAYAIFLTRRIARIYPLYACVTVLLFAASAFAVAEAAAPESTTFLLISNLLLIQSWGIAPSIDLPAWSISTEWAAYVLFPILVGATLLSRPRVACALGLATMAGVALIAFSPNGNGPDIRHGPLDIFAADSLLPLGRCLCEFTLGLLCFRLESSISIVPDRFRGRLLAGISLCIVLLLIWPDSDIILVPLFAALVILLARGTNAVAGALASPIAYRLGVLSYAIYLLHMHMYKFRTVTEAKLALHLPAGAATDLGFIAAYTMLLATSWLAFTFIERPGRKLIRKAENLFGLSQSQAVR